MSSLDLNFTNQIAKIDAWRTGDSNEDNNAGRVNKIVKNNHSLAFPNVSNARFHYDSDDSIYDL